MKFYDITYMIEDEQHKKLSDLTERYAKIKGWNENQVLQFAVNRTIKADMKTKLSFLENEIVRLEKEWQDKGKDEQKQVYISDEEREKCRKVVNAYGAELDDVKITVVDAGKYGFVKLTYYKFPYGFDEAITYTDSLELFFDIWEEWLETQLLRLTKNTPIAELDYEDMFKCLSKEKQEELFYLSDSFQCPDYQKYQMLH